MIVIDREMPKRCNDCFCENTENGTKCGMDLTKDLTYNDAMVRRPEWCPLKDGPEEETVEPELECGGSSWWYVCGECHSIVNDRDNYCRECGKRVLWK